MSLIKPKRRNQKFTADEDKLLKKLVRNHGESSWELISSYMEDRNPRQCHDRWTYYLSPKINNSPWTEEDDKRLIDTCYELNGKWVKITKNFKGRTDVQIKNRWNYLQKTKNLPDIKKKKKTIVISDEETKKKTLDEPTHNIEDEAESQLLSSILDNCTSLFKNIDQNPYDFEFVFLS